MSSKLGKVLRRTLPCYLPALVRTGAGLGDWRRFAADSVLYGARQAGASSGCRPGQRSDNFHVCGVRRCGRRARDPQLRVCTERVQVVGNPDLGHFGLTESMLGSRLTGE